MLFTAASIPRQKFGDRIDGLLGFLSERQKRGLRNLRDFGPELVEAAVEVELLVELRGGDEEHITDEETARDGGQVDGEEALVGVDAGDPGANVCRHAEEERENQDTEEHVGAAPYRGESHAAERSP